MNILIIGATGYTGSHLVKQLVATGNHKVVALTRKAPGLTSSPNVNWIQADMNDSGWLDAVPGEIDSVVYLAQSNRYREFPDGAFDMMRINTQCVLEALEWSRQHTVSQFVFTSTGNVYKPSQSLYKEEDPVYPSSFYAASKINAENLVMQYSSFFETIIFRVFSVYGKGQEKMMIPSIIDKIKKQQKILLTGSKGILLSPIYIEDAVHICETAIQSRLKPGIYNLAGKEVVSLAEIISLLERQMNQKSLIEITGGEYPRLAANAEKLFSEMNYSPAITMEKGIQKLFE